MQVHCNLLYLLEQSNSRFNLAYQLLQAQIHSNLQANGIFMALRAIPFPRVRYLCHLRARVCVVKEGTSFPGALCQSMGVARSGTPAQASRKKAVAYVETRTS